MRDIMIRVFFFLFGFGFTTIGFSFMILYLNLMTIGYKFKDYVNFIIRRPECYFWLFGFIIMTISIFNIKGDEKHELYL